MALGGFAPCPLPLGGSATDGLTAEQHARVAADLKAAVLSAPFAVLAIVPNKQLYLAQFGEGFCDPYVAGVTPLISSGGVGIVNVDFPPSYNDEYDNALAVNIRQAQVTHCWTVADVAPVYLTVTINSPTSLTIYSVDNTGAPALLFAAFLTVW